MRENDGNSYFFFTAVAYGLGSVAIAIQQAVDTQASRGCFAAFTAVCMVLALLNIVSLFARTYLGQRIEISPPFFRRVPGRFYVLRSPWRIARVIDCTAAYTGALALVMMCFWIYDDTPDKHLYFSFCKSARGCENIWDAWLVTNMQASELFTASTLTLEPLSAWTVLYKLLTAGSSYAFNFMLFATVVAEGYAQAQARQQQEVRKLQRSAANDDDVPENGSAGQTHTYRAHLVPVSAPSDSYHDGESTADRPRSGAFEF
jgi:hypothetical protein